IPNGFSVGQKMGFKPKQVYQYVSKKATANTSTNKNKNVDPPKESSSPSTTPTIEKINKMENLIIDGKAILVNNEGKPLRKVDEDSEDDVASDDNEMASFLAKKDGYGTQSLLEQWKDSHELDDYEYDHTMICLIFVAPSGEILPESNTTSMEMEHSDSHSNIPTGDVTIDIGRAASDEQDTPSSSIATKRIAEFHCYQKILKHIYTLALVVMFPALTQVAQLKFQNKSPFESHTLFANMGVAAFVVAILASVTFFAMGDYLESHSCTPSVRVDVARQ
ncbi:hypothetical protein Tco_0327350, partial [Tanacetum coccineum]